MSWVRYAWISDDIGLTLVRLCDVGRKVTFLTARWINPLNHNRCQFVFAWPRRDNLWSRWRYQSFTKDGTCVHWKWAAQRVFW